MCLSENNGASILQANCKGTTWYVLPMTPIICNHSRIPWALHHSFPHLLQYWQASYNYCWAPLIDIKLQWSSSIVIQPCWSISSLVHLHGALMINIEHHQSTSNLFNPLQALSTHFHLCWLSSDNHGPSWTLSMQVHDCLWTCPTVIDIIDLHRASLTFIRWPRQSSPYVHQTSLTVYSAVFGSLVMMVAAPVHYRLHWDRGLYVVEYH